MPPRLRGKWALGITPRNFTWILKDKLAICERPGGVGDSHRRVRRQEEIIWLRENGFGSVISIIVAPHNLHNYEELQLPYRHRPFSTEHTDQYLTALYTEIRRKCDALHCALIAANGGLDHTHVLVRLWPTVSVAKLVQGIKGASSRLLNQRFELPELFRWQEGYGAFSISQRNVALVAEYVTNQKQRHAEGTAVEAMERCWLGA